MSAETEEEPEFAVDFNVAESEQANGEPAENANGEDSEEGARRWRGRRRRRGGRRGRGFSSAAKAAPSRLPSKPLSPGRRAASAHRAPCRARRVSSGTDRSRPVRTESRPRQEYGPPAGYTPIILPGESISKYRNLPAVEQEAGNVLEVDHDDVASMPVDDFITPVSYESETDVEEEIQEEATHLDQGFEVVEEEQVAAVAETEQAEAAPVVEEDKPARGRRGRWGWRNRKAAAEAEKAEAAPQDVANVEAEGKERMACCCRKLG